MFRAMISTVAITFAVALSCQSCAAQERVGQTPNPVPAPNAVAPNEKVPATQPAGGTKANQGGFTAVGGSGMVIVLGEAGAGTKATTEAVPPPPGQVRHTWRALGGKDEARNEAREEEGIFVNGRRIRGPGSGGVGMRPPMMFGEGPVKMEKAAYLGLSTSPVNEALASQLGLAKGLGLLVDVVDDNGPAKKGGLEKFDVLTKLDDQLVINPPQLQVLVRMHKAGDQVKLTVFRKAKETVLPVTLVEKELPPLQPFWGMGPDAKPGHEAGEAEEQAAERGEIAKAMERLMRGEGAGDSRRQATVSVVDGDRMMVTKIDPWTGKHFLTVTDTKAGKVLFNGPVDTPEERKAVPPQILKTWETMNIRMIMPGEKGPGAPLPPTPAVPDGPGSGNR